MKIMFDQKSVSNSSLKLHNFEFLHLENEKENISQLSSTINIKITSKPVSPKNVSILDLTTN